MMFIPNGKPRAPTSAITQPGPAVSRCPSGHNRARSGATAVEFAVVGQVLFLLVFGIIELGRALMVLHILSEVARDAARYAIVAEGSYKSSANLQTYVSNRLTVYGVSTANTPIVSINDSSSTDLSTATGPAQKAGASNWGKYSNGTEVTVKVQINFSEFTWLPTARYLDTSITLSGQYTLRRDPM
jgi:Flp pilus assembly protein TadG